MVKEIDPEAVDDAVDDGELDEKRAHESVNKIRAAVDGISHWPPSAQTWLKTTPVKLIIESLVKDPENHFNLQNANAKTKAKVTLLLLEGDFGEKVKVARAKLNSTNSSSSTKLNFSKMLPVAAGCAIGWTMGYLYYQRGGKDKIKKIVK